MRPPEATARKCVLSLAGMGVFCVLLASVVNPYPAWGQSTNEHLRFEVASIKQRTDTGAQRAGIEDTPNLVRIENLTLRGVIKMAYGVTDFQLVVPDWTTRTRFDIQGKPPAGYTKENLRPLLRNLLADRFKLVTHNERREVTGFTLRIASGGHKLPAAAGESGYFTARAGLISGPNRTIADLVSQLISAVGGPVDDQTGLTGRYNLNLEWTPDGGAAAPELSIFTALREQMGLRLEASKVTTDVVVVDRIERTPTED